MVSLTTPEPGAGRGGGRGRGVYSSAVGEPGAGVPIPNRGGGGRGTPRLQRHSAGGRPTPRRHPGQRRPRHVVNDPARSMASVTVPDECGGTRIRRTGLFRPSGVVYAVSADGMFRTLGLVSGKDVQRPAPFVPAGARFSDLIAVNDRALHRHERRMRRRRRRRLGDRHRERHEAVVSWKTNGGSPIGSVAFATNGTAIVAIGPGTVTAGGLRERDRRARSEDARREGLVQAARRRVRGAAPLCFRRPARTSSPSRRRTGASCCSTPARSAARITTRRCSRRRRSPAGPQRSRHSHRRCGRSAHRSPPQPRLRLPRSSAPLAAMAHAGCSFRSRVVAGEPGSSREWRRVERRHTRRQARAPGRQVLGPTGLDLAEHRRAADAHRCQWCRVRGFRSAERAGRALRAARSDRQAALAQRKDDHVPAVGPEFLGRIRSRVRGNAGRHRLRVRVRNGTEVEGEMTTSSTPNFQLPKAFNAPRRSLRFLGGGSWKYWHVRIAF